MLRIVLLPIAVLSVSGCGDPGAASPEDPDAGTDGGLDAGPPLVAAPELPRLAPCPDGWTQTFDPDVADLVTCSPWPGREPARCEDDEAHFPGEPGCRRIGAPCDAGRYATDLPADVPIHHVDAAAVVDGVGTVASPFSRIASALAAADDGDVIALSKGTFEEEIVVDEAVTLWGACVAETLIASSVGSEVDPTVRLAQTGARLRNLRVSGERIGVVVEAPAAPAEMQDVLVDGARGTGISVDRAAARATDVVVRDGRARTSDGEWGFGITIQRGATLDVERALVEENKGVGIIVSGADTVLTAVDLAVVETQAMGPGAILGMGLQVLEGARADLSRTAIVGNRAIGISLFDPGSSLEAVDLLIRDTHPQEVDLGFGLGLDAFLGAEARIERATIESNRGAAVRAMDGAFVELIDAALCDTSVRASDGLGGYGLDVHGGADVRIERVVVARNERVGVVAAQAGTRLEGTDLAVVLTDSHLVEVAEGYGIQVSEGAVVDVERAAIDRNRMVGVSAFHEGTMVTLRDLVVSDLRLPTCAEVGCPETAVGAGLLALDGAHVEATRFVVRDGPVCGIQLARGGTIDLHGGTVSDNAIGVNVQTDGFDLDRLRDEVRYVDNGIDLDSAALPVPAAHAGF